jgi:hypothetical protein
MMQQEPTAIDEPCNVHNTQKGTRLELEPLVHSINLACYLARHTLFL